MLNSEDYFDEIPSAQEIMQRKLKAEETILYRDYDDSSDEEETPSYRISSKKRIIAHTEEIKEMRQSIRFLRDLQDSEQADLDKVNELDEKITADRIKDICLSINSLKDLQNSEQADQDRVDELEEKITARTLELKELQQSINYLRDIQLIEQADQDRIVELEKEIQIKEQKVYDLEVIPNNLEFLLETLGREAIYKYLPQYRMRKSEVFGQTKFAVQGALYYDLLLAQTLIETKIINEDRFRNFKIAREKYGKNFKLLEGEILDTNFLQSIMEDMTFDNDNERNKEMKELSTVSIFNEENKFSLLRDFLRQSNRERLDHQLIRDVQNFASKLRGSTVLDKSLIITVVKVFVSTLPQRPPRKFVKKTYVNQDITSVEEFFVEELLRHRSLIRRSRESVENRVEISQSLVFSSKEDLVSQKKQSSSKSSNTASNSHFLNRGTIEEEVLNLGNYKNVLRKLRTLNFDDKSLAQIVRKVFCKGVKHAFDTLDVKGVKLSKFLSKEKKQIIVDTVELLYGTEGFRAPSTIIETNMLLDLIICDPNNWSFEKAFLGKSIPQKLDKKIQDKVTKWGGHLIAQKPNDSDEVEIGELINPESGKVSSNWKDLFNPDESVLYIILQGAKKYFTGEVTKEILTTLRSIADIENGGALSYTMKSVKGHSGGIACGRKFSRRVDELLDDDRTKLHKYGGSFDVRKDDFIEYSKRKFDIAQSWVQRFTSSKELSYENINHEVQQRWYGR